jgi:Uma2 family endonuclease
MSSILTRLVSWKEFEQLPDPDDGQHLELHDGEVVAVPPPKPRHSFVQMRIQELFRVVENFGFIAATEFPYKPAPDYQFWYADVAVLPRSVRAAMAYQREWELYAPPLIVEVLSPSNRPRKLNQQRAVAMSHGTQEFWVVDADTRSVHVTTRDSATMYSSGQTIPLYSVPTVQVTVDEIFSDLA